MSDSVLETFCLFSIPESTGICFKSILFSRKNSRKTAAFRADSTGPLRLRISVNSAICLSALLRITPPSIPEILELESGVLMFETQ